ncbi:MAG: hypothetical protein EBU36_05490 [Verrucomicrobia bacterium]|nr:hypothetical protein [Verrucomicrobiota bacterium]
MSVDYIHPVSGLRLLRAQLPAAERRAPPASDDAYWQLVHENQRFHNEMSIKEQKKLAAEQEDMERQEREDAAGFRRQDAIARLRGPIRIRPEPENRDLADEEKAAAALVAHHTRRADEEIALIRQKFACARDRSKATFIRKMESAHVTYAQKIATIPADDEHGLAVRSETYDYTAQLEDLSAEYRCALGRFRDSNMQYRIQDIQRRREQLAWTCPNDGQAHPFTWKDREYHRTYNGEMWDTQSWVWAGRWNNYYITTCKAPIEDEVSAELRMSLSPFR